MCIKINIHSDIIYRPKDSPSIGLTQINILGNTIFGSSLNGGGVNTVNVSSTPNAAICSSNLVPLNSELVNEDDMLAKTSVGWIRILSRCFAAEQNSKLTSDIIDITTAYPGFLEACCSLMNTMPMIPSNAIQNLEIVLMKLGNYNCQLCLTLIRTLLWSATPQSKFILIKKIFLFD